MNKHSSFKIMALLVNLLSQSMQLTHYSVCVCALVAWSCPTLCNTMDCSPPGSSIHGVFQTRILEWVAISFSRGSSQPKDLDLNKYQWGNKQKNIRFFFSFSFGGSADNGRELISPTSKQLKRSFVSRGDDIQLVYSTKR